MGDVLLRRCHGDGEGEDWEALLGFRPDAVQADLLERPVRRLLLNCSRQWGKSTITAAKAVGHARSRPESLTLVVSPSARQSGEFLRKVKGMARRLGLPECGDGLNEISQQFPNDARIVGLPGKEETVRGYTAVSLLLIDEAALVRDSMYYSLRPMLAMGDGDLWLMSTPRGKRGFFWEEWSKGEGWEKVAVPAAESGRISARFLAEERRSMGDRWFRQEYCCEFTECEEALFSLEVIERAISTDVKPLFQR